MTAPSSQFQVPRVAPKGVMRPSAQASVLESAWLSVRTFLVPSLLLLLLLLLLLPLPHDAAALSNFLDCELKQKGCIVPGLRPLARQQLTIALPCVTEAGPRSSPCEKNRKKENRRIIVVFALMLCMGPGARSLCAGYRGQCSSCSNLSLSHSLTHSLTRSLARSLSRSRSLSLSLSLSISLSLTHTHTHT